MEKNFFGVFRLIAVVFVEEFPSAMMRFHHFLQLFSQLIDLTLVEYGYALEKTVFLEVRHLFGGKRIVHPLLGAGGKGKQIIVPTGKKAKVISRAQVRFHKFHIHTLGRILLKILDASYNHLQIQSVIPSKYSDFG